jgi:hypothetical protein
MVHGLKGGPEPESKATETGHTELAGALELIDLLWDEREPDLSSEVNVYF